MKLSQIILLPILVFQIVSAKPQWYPVTKKDELKSPLVPFQIGTKIGLECMQRNIDNGEHKADLDGNIVFIPFPTCKETGEPLLLSYGVNEEVSCTVSMTDNLYHLFQLYLHEDAPFSCRLPISADPELAKSGLTVPLVFNLRGTLSESHIHIDNNINILNVKPLGFNGLISSVLFSSGTNVTRVIIGDLLKLNFAVRWVDVSVLKAADDEYHYGEGFYKLPSYLSQSLIGLGLYIVITAIISALVTYGAIYSRFNSKNNRHQIYDIEGLSKKD